ncbi:MAG: HNH endonuclease signature motif containing protein [Byssovorax sp.]
MTARIPEDVRARVRAAAGDRCGYCMSRQKYVLGLLEVEHIVPRAAGGTDREDNLWLACRLCNGFKGARKYGLDPVTGTSIPLYNPRSERWSVHFAWSEDGLHILGKTASGRATVATMQLNNGIAVAVRREWVTAGWHPPPD